MIMENIAAFALIKKIIKIVSHDDTQIISKEALVIISNKEQALKMRKAIDYYHTTATWEGSGLNEIYEQLHIQKD